MASKQSDPRRRIDLRISGELAALLSEEATREHRTLNAHITHLLQRHVDGELGAGAAVRKHRRGLAVKDHAAAVLERKE